MESLLKEVKANRAVVLIDDGICKENETLVTDLFCRLGHHLSVSVILLTQTLFDSKNPALRIIHRNAKSLIIFACPRDMGSLRILLHQMLPNRSKASILLNTVEKELEKKPYNYVMFDFQPNCPVSQRFKLDILDDPHYLTFKNEISSSLSAMQAGCVR